MIALAPAMGVVEAYHDAIDGFSGGKSSYPPRLI
jgi:hypothetical protein